MSNIILTVFTKPWFDPLERLADKVAGLGLDGIELPVRPGYQVTPDAIGAGLKDAVKIMASRGLVIRSVAGSVDEATVVALGDAGVPILRIVAGIDMKIGYKASFDNYRRNFDALLPVLERHNVTIGVQNHYGNCIGSAAGLLHLIEPYDPRQVSAVLDMAHCGVSGEPTDLAVDIVWERMHGLINFKSAFQRLMTGPEEPHAEYHVHWTTHQHAAYSWARLVEQMQKRGFRGAFCLPAEYSDPAGKPQHMGDDVLPYLTQDIAYLKSLLAA